MTAPGSASPATETYVTERVNEARDEQLVASDITLRMVTEVNARGNPPAEQQPGNGYRATETSRISGMTAPEINEPHDGLDNAVIALRKLNGYRGVAQDVATEYVGREVSPGFGDQLARVMMAFDSRERAVGLWNGRADAQRIRRGGR